LRKKFHLDEKKLSIAFCTYTGKASRVLKSKLKETKAVYPKDTVSTIHSLIYSPIVNKNEEIVGWELKDKIKHKLIIIDEASMVDEKIWKDLLSYGTKIIAVGDHGQLPPISSNFNLMKKPKLLLTEIHRQAKENPIIQLSIMARNKGTIPVGKYSDTVMKFDTRESDTQEVITDLLQGYNAITMILCGYNSTRIKINQFIRNAFEIHNPLPQEGDRVICLRNNHKKQIFNGMLGTITTIVTDDEQWFYAEIDMDDEDKQFKGLISAKQFNNPSQLNFSKKRKEIMKGDLFDFGYALTVHKAQGSQAKRVILFEERFRQMDDQMWKRWLYTAVTRAEEELYIFGQ